MPERKQRSESLNGEKLYYGHLSRAPILGATTNTIPRLIVETEGVPSAREEVPWRSGMETGGFAAIKLVRANRRKGKN